MFDVGFWELIILFGLGLVILGPERLPKVAMQVGNWAGQARRMARTLTMQMKEELDLNQAYTPPKSSYSRPGMDDLKPQSTEEEDEIENSIYEEPDTRDHTDAGSEEDTLDHTDAGAEAVEPAEPAKDSKP